MKQQKREIITKSPKTIVKNESQKLASILYGQKIYIKNLTLDGEGSYLWGRGFIDKNIYLSTKTEQIQSQFTIQPKKGLYNFEDKTRMSVVFGTEVLIRHVLSQEYIAIGQHDGMPVLQFQKQQSASCYFQFSPLRTFQSNGNAIAVDSIFLIMDSERKLHLSNQDYMIYEEPSSLAISKKKTNMDELLFMSTRLCTSSLDIPLQHEQQNPRKESNSQDGEEDINQSEREQQQVNKIQKKKIDQDSTFKIRLIPHKAPTAINKKNGKDSKDDKQKNQLPQTLTLFNKTTSAELQIPQQKIDKKMVSILPQLDAKKINLKQSLKKQNQENYQNLNQFLNLFPIYQKCKKLSLCTAENSSYTQWKIEMVRTDLCTQYLNNNDYIYFTHSQANQTMIIDIQKSPMQVAYIKNTNESENQFIVSSIFVVEIESRKYFKSVYLRHLLTNRYFPFSNGHKDEEKKICQFVPLLAHKKNQCPPFRILFGGKPFRRNEKNEKQTLLHGFWVTKIPKTQIAQIMSIQYVDEDTSIQYLMNYYLRQSTKRRQNILRQFQHIPYLINELSKIKNKKTNNENDDKLNQIRIRKCFQLLFFICRNNEKNKKYCLRYVQKILEYSKKQEIIGLLTQLLIDNQNSYNIQKAITPTIIQSQISQFVQRDSYLPLFIRIFRVFCCSDEQPSARNQCLLFNLFFWDKKSEEGYTISESLIKTCKKMHIPDKFKFRMFEQEGKIYFSNGIFQQIFQKMDDKIIDYIRQYLYLLSDCMNGNNYNIIKKFTQIIDFNLLLKLLQKKQLNGPALSLLYHAYLKPQKKYKANIFHLDYQKICDKGSLIYYCNDNQALLRNFLDRELRENKDYNSTSFRILLNVFKSTIQNGYWKKFDDLIDLMGYLDRLIELPDSQNAYHLTYEQKSQDWNLLRSKITAVSIKILLIDMQISLWASNFKQFSERDIEQKIVPEIKNSKNWIIDQRILKLCSTNSPQLLRKAILLLYKIYNLYKLTQKTFEEAKVEFDSKIKLSKVFETLQLKDQISIQNYFSVIAACIKDPISLTEICPKSLKQNDYFNLQSMFKYKQVNQEVQNMVWKLGLHQIIIKDISRYSVMQKHKKFKQRNQQIIYWELLTLYATIRYNSKVRDLISEYRAIFIPFIQAEHPNYYIAVDIIEEIYRNNRKLIISDNNQLKQICKLIDKVFRASKQDLRCCKIVSLLSVFLQTGNREIVQNNQIILQVLFNKEFVRVVTKIMTTGIERTDSVSDYIRDSHPKNILRIVLYDLVVMVGQKKMLKEVERPKNDIIEALLLMIGNNNWSLKVKAFLSIRYEGIKQSMVQSCLRIIFSDLSYMCQSFKTSEQQCRQVSKQVKIYISNMSKILQTIANIFKICEKTIQKITQSDEQILMIKIMQRLFIIKILCPETIHKKMDNLLIYSSIIDKKLNRKSEGININQIFKNISIADYQVKERLPLVYSERLKNKKKIDKKLQFKHKSSSIEETMSKKMKIEAKVSDINRTNLKMTEDKIKEFKILIINLSNLNKNNSKFLSGNIKQFLVNFIKISFLQCQDKQKFNYMQNILVNYQIPAMICSILQQPFKHRYKLFSTVFQLGIKLLSGGHYGCQQKFLQKFKQDNKNWIFQNIYQIIIDSLTTIEFYYYYKQDSTIKSYQMILQSQQYFICKEQRKLSCQLLAYAFRFLQLLCEKDNHAMKDYIYNQLDKEDHVKYMSINFIEVAQRILDRVLIVIEFNIYELQRVSNEKFERQVRGNIFNLPIYILDFLIEVCQIPADQNQLFLCRTDFLNFIRKLILIRQAIKQSQKNREKDWNIFFIYQKKIIILLKSLLQQNLQEITNIIRKKIGCSQFIFFIQQSFLHGGLRDTQKLKQMLTQMQLNAYIQNIVDVLIIKKIIKNQQILEFQSDDPKKPNQKNIQKLKIINQLNNRIQSIHVDFKNHSLTVYFPYHPLFALLGKKTKDFMLDRSANLMTRRQKLTEFLLSRQIMYQEINHQKNSQKRMMNTQKMAYIFNFALFLCFLIVLLLVLFYSVGKSGAVLDLYQSQFISGLSYMQLLVIIFYSIILGLNLYPVAKQKMLSYQKLRKKSQNNTFDEGIKSDQRSIFSYLLQVKSVYVDDGNVAEAFVLLVISLYACFFQVRVYSFSLVFVFAKIELLGSILKSIRLTWQQLVFVSLLALAFSFIFGFLTLNNYIGPLYQNEQIDIGIDRINEHCNSVITCVSSIYTQKIIGESVGRGDEQYNYSRFISDLVYWGFFQILMSNIIAAIIIDKFAEQRNVKQKVLLDRYSKCFICFAERSTLERRGEDFMSHVGYVHNIWNYLFYIYILENMKDITEFTGIEYWINRQIKNNMIDWIPIDDSFKDEDLNLSELAEKLRPFLVEKQLDEK